MCGWVPADREVLDEMLLVSTYGQSSMTPVEQRIFVSLFQKADQGCVDAEF